MNRLEKRYIATTGFFDGVHKGHVTVLDKLKETGSKFGLPVSVVTFWPHPRIVLNKDQEKFGLLSTLEEKKRRIESFGIDIFTVIPFTKEFSLISPEQFVNKLYTEYGIAGLCIGYDHHVGRNRSAGFDEIKQICDRAGMYCERVNPLIAGSVAVSSEKIRKYLSENLIEEANAMLGYSYSLTGTIVHGKKFGRTIGFPTANLDLQNPLKMIPADGVYSVEITINDCQCVFNGMLFIGKKTPDNSGPTFIEVNIFDFDREIYDRQAIVYLKKFIRKNRRFENIDDMKIQLRKDRQNIMEIINQKMITK